MIKPQIKPRTITITMAGLRDAAALILLEILILTGPSRGLVGVGFAMIELSLDSVGFEVMVGVSISVARWASRLDSTSTMMALRKDDKTEFWDFLSELCECKDATATLREDDRTEFWDSECKLCDSKDAAAALLDDDMTEFWDWESKLCDCRDATAALLDDDKTEFSDSESGA